MKKYKLTSKEFKEANIPVHIKHEKLLKEIRRSILKELEKLVDPAGFVAWNDILQTLEK
jgi:hypothetical protein